MKVFGLISWSLLSSVALVSAHDKQHTAKIYRFADQTTSNSLNTIELPLNDAKIYLDNVLGKDQSKIDLPSSSSSSSSSSGGSGSNGDALIDALNEQYEYQEKQNNKPTLVINVKGVDFDEFSKPIVQTSDKINKYFKKQMKEDGAGVRKLTDELLIISQRKYPELYAHFKYFQEKKDYIWKEFTLNGGAVSGTGSKVGSQNVLKNQYSPVNDQLFINELAMLIHLQEFAQKEAQIIDKSDVLLITSSSLLSISRKIGMEAETFIHAKQTIVNLLTATLSQNFNIVVVATPKTMQDISHLHKRSSELVKKASASNVFKYGTKEACEVGTNKCNSHGECSKLTTKKSSKRKENAQANEEEWGCVCQPSFNKTISKTTTWVGYDCSKKDVSVEANLFLWTTIALLLVTVGGIKLMMSIGSGPLPGVLDAATLPGKKNL